MAFGFDPRLILAAEPARETLSDLLNARTQREVHQATLADMVRKREQEATLADILRQNAGDPSAVGPAAMRAGLGSVALGWMDRQAELEQRKALAQKAYQDSFRQRAEMLGRPFRGVKDQAGLDAAFEALRQIGLQDQQLASFPRVYDQKSAPFYERLAALGLSTEDAEKLDRRDLEREAANERARIRQRTAQTAAERKAEEAARKAAEKKAEGAKLLTIEGYELDPAFDVKPDVAEKLRKAQAESKSMTKNVDELMSLYKKYGNKVLPGQARARMEAIARHLQLRAKGETMFQLGVIAGPDMELLNSVVPVPTKKDATIADFFSGGGDASETMERLRVMREQVGENFHDAVTARGYRKKGGQKAGANTKPARSAAEIQAELDALRGQP